VALTSPRLLFSYAPNQPCPRPRCLSPTQIWDSNPSCRWPVARDGPDCPPRYTVSTLPRFPADPHVNSAMGDLRDFPQLRHHLYLKHIELELVLLTFVQWLEVSRCVGVCH